MTVKYSKQDEEIYQLFEKQLQYNIQHHPADWGDFRYWVVSHFLSKTSKTSEFTTSQIKYSLDKRVKAGDLVKKVEHQCTKYAKAADIKKDNPPP